MCVCVLLCCGGACVWCVVMLGTLSLSCSLSFLFSFPCAFPFFFSLIFLFLSSLSFSFSLFFFFFSCSFSYSCSCSFSFFLLYSLLATTHHGKNRSTNTAANIEAFECDLAQGKCTAVGSLPPPLLPLPPFSSPSNAQKREGTLITGIFPARNLFLITVFN